MKEKYVKIISKECPMCGEETYLRLTKEQVEQWKNYICYGGLIQDKLSTLDEFGREFIKMGYCPSCQEMLFQSTLKDKSPFISWVPEQLNEDRMHEFSQATEEMNARDAIFSEAADKLSIQEKVFYLFEMDLEEEYYVDSEGKVKKMDETA